MAGDERFGDRASRIVHRISRGEEAVASTLVFSQIFAYLRWKKKAEIIPTFIGFLRSLPSLNKVETTFEDILLSQKLQRGGKLRWETWDDLVIAAQMKRMKIDEIYSNDADFDEIQDIRRIFE